MNEFECFLTTPRINCGYLEKMIPIVYYQVQYIPQEMCFFEKKEKQKKTQQKIALRPFLMVGENLISKLNPDFFLELLCTTALLVEKNKSWFSGYFD
jgi:hypothetical protein